MKATTAEDKRIIDFCTELFGEKPDNEELYIVAFTHSSYANENNRPSNERLEFLGDSVVGLCVAEYLYKTYPESDEGDYSKIKSAVVSTDNFALICERLGLEEYLKLNNKAVRNSAGRKYMANLFEAVLGAYYLDKGFEAARKFALKHLVPDISQIAATGVVSDYKTALFELAQRRRDKIEFIMLERTGPDHAPRFVFSAEIDGVTYGIGDGSSKAEAKQEAARAAYMKYYKEG